MFVAKKLLLVGLFGFLFVGTLGFAQLGMSMNSQGQMSGCPLMGTPTLCHMSPLEHAFTLQNMLTAAVPFSGIFSLLLSILLAFSFVLLAQFLWRNTGLLSEPILRPPSRRDRYTPRHALQEAFARGILNTKAF